MTEVIEIAAGGLLVVMTAMLLLTGMGFALRRWSTQAVARAAEAGSGDLSLVDPVLLAVLAAAASEALGGPVVLRHVHITPRAQAEQWSRAGRMDIMISHRVGPQR